MGDVADGAVGATAPRPSTLEAYALGLQVHEYCLLWALTYVNRSLKVGQVGALGISLRLEVGIVCSI